MEDSNGSESDNSLADSGAVYLFNRDGSTWSQLDYLKADNAGAQDQFGYAVALSGDGRTLVVGAPTEDSGSTGIDGEQGNNSTNDAGAVYIFIYRDTGWVRQAYAKAANTGAGDRFGSAVALSHEGNILAVGAPEEDSNAIGIDGDASNNAKTNSGAVYLFRRSGSIWSRQAYVKASNTRAGDRFGNTVSLSGDGATLAVGAWGENGSATGINSGGTSYSAPDSGAAYLFTQDLSGWQQDLHLKSSNSESGDRFGWSVSLNDNGTVLVVGARLEDSGAVGINGDPLGNSMGGAGAAYLFNRDGGGWNQQSYIKASNSGTGDQFGRAVCISGDGATLAVGGYREDGGSTGVNGDISSESGTNSGAVYLY